MSARSSFETGPGVRPMRLGDDAAERLDELNRRVARMVQMVRQQNRSLDGLVAVRADDLQATVQELAVLRRSISGSDVGAVGHLETELTALEAALDADAVVARPLRTRFYDWLGALLAVGLVAAGTFAVVGVTGPGIITIEAALFALGIAVAVVGIGVIVLALSFSDLARRGHRAV